MAAKQETWILLRGLTREHGHWGSFLEQFAAERPGAEILPLDLPGTGEHFKLQSPKTISGIFNFVRAEAVSKSRAQGRFKILGISMGAMVAMEWMRQKSDDLEACVFVNTSVGKASPFYHRMRWQEWNRVLRIVTQPAPREREKAVVDLIMNNAAAREVAWPQWAKIAQERPVSFKNVLHQTIAASRFTGVPKDSQVPVLLLSGLGDRLVDPSCSSALHENYGWPIVRHPWAGHDLTCDDPEWVCEKINKWNAKP